MSGTAAPGEPEPHRLSVVVPVFQGERTLGPLVKEIEPLTRPSRTPGGRAFRVLELILVHDGAEDGSDAVMQSLAASHAFVTNVWLSRNYGQHPATLAGMAGTTGDWVATLDEDGQHDPADLGRMLDRAIETGASLVYARPLNAPPHGALRNLLSRMARGSWGWIVGGPRLSEFHSFRFMRGEIARGLAAYCGHGVYLDVALSWVVDSCETCPVTLRAGGTRPSGYTYGKLVAHFWRLLFTSGTRPLRLVGILGATSIFLGLGITGRALWLYFTQGIPVKGWTSLIIALCFFSGLILFSLSIVAGYLGMTMTMAMGKPLYLVVPGPARRGGGKP